MAARKFVGRVGSDEYVIWKEGLEEFSLWQRWISGMQCREYIWPAVAVKIRLAKSLVRMGGKRIWTTETVFLWEIMAEIGCLHKCVPIFTRAYSEIS